MDVHTVEVAPTNIPECAFLGWMQTDLCLSHRVDWAARS